MSPGRMKATYFLLTLPAIFLRLAKKWVVGFLTFFFSSSSNHAMHCEIHSSKELIWNGCIFLWLFSYSWASWFLFGAVSIRCSPCVFTCLSVILSVAMSVHFSQSKHHQTCSICSLDWCVKLQHLYTEQFLWGSPRGVNALFPLRFSSGLCSWISSYTLLPILEDVLFRLIQNKHASVETSTQTITWKGLW